MDIAVQKYGGTSLASIDRLERVALHIKASLGVAKRLVVVVSALGNFTDEWLDIATSLNPSPPKREMDMLLTVGERVSSSLLCMALHALGVEAISLTGSQCGILTDANHGNAKISAIRCSRLTASLQDYQVLVVAGFQGVCLETNDVTTLGRGGSDVTAIALAVVLAAQRCEIYTDVAGVMTADPKLDPNAKVINLMSWADMQAVADGGAQIMHPRACRLARKYALPFVVRSSFDFSLPGTQIGDQGATPRAVGLADSPLES